MVKKKEKELQIEEFDIDKPNKRYDYTFYSNVAQVTASELDAYIDFIQFPPIDNITPTVRIYLSRKHLKEIFEVVKTLPGISENEDEE